MVGSLPLHTNIAFSSTQGPLAASSTSQLHLEVQKSSFRFQWFSLKGRFEEHGYIMCSLVVEHTLSMHSILSTGGQGRGRRGWRGGICAPLTPVLRMQRQENLYGFEISLIYIENFRPALYSKTLSPSPPPPTPHPPKGKKYLLNLALARVSFRCFYVDCDGWKQGFFHSKELSRRDFKRYVCLPEEKVWLVASWL